MKKEIRDFLKRYQEEIRRAASSMSGEELPQITEELFALFETTGNRTEYEAVYFRRRKFLAVFALASLLWGQEQDVEKLVGIIREICGELCWALPAHVDREGKPGSWMRTVDLFACETGFALAEIRELLWEVLPGEVRDLMEKRVLERVIEPFEESQVPCGVWENCHHNWNAVCAGSIGAASLYLLNGERLERILDRLQKSLVHYVEGFSEDGACMEGVGYFTYGMSFYTAFSQMLEKHTKGRKDLLAGEKLQRMMEFQQKCYFPGGLSVSFSDGSSREKFRVGLTCFLKRKNQRVRFPNFRLSAGLDSDSCYRWCELYRDYLWAAEYLEAVSGEEAGETVNGEDCQTVLSDAQWSICRGAFQTGMAAKGGHNGEPHNHNDVGSFHYVVGDEIFLVDLGAGEYTRDYFRDETRYGIFVNQSQSHNLPIIGGQGQSQGKDFYCSRFFADGRGNTSMELQEAYQIKGLTSFVRKLSFSPEEGSLFVEDNFEGQRKILIWENLVTPLLPQIEGSRVLLCGEKQSCVLEVETDQVISVREKIYPDHEGREAKVYLLGWPVKWIQNRAGARFRIGIL